MTKDDQAGQGARKGAIRRRRGRGELGYLFEKGAEGLDQFYRAHAGRVLRWAISLGGGRIDHEDVAQEVFAIALKRLHTFRGDSAVETWLFGITRRVIANHRRKATFRRLVFLGQDFNPVSTDRLADEELDRLRRRRQVQRALNRLKRNHREALVLVDLQGSTAVEAAEMLEVPVGTVYSRLHHARRSFAHALEVEGVAQVPYRSRRFTVLPPQGLE